MKKIINLTRFKYLILIYFLFFLFSCKKEGVDSGQKSISKYQITQQEINNWADNNPVVKYLALDWKNAKKTVFKGHDLIKITLLNENRMPYLKNNSLKTDGTQPQTKKVLPPSYNYQHPPEVYLVKDDKDSLHSSLINFIPDNVSQDFGENYIWTGKLYEWNMNSDSIFVQHIVKNKLFDKYIIKKISTIDNLGKAGVKTESLWSWLGDVVNTIDDLFSSVGYFIGIPGARNPWWYDDDCSRGLDCRRNWSWDWAGDGLDWIGGLFMGNGNTPDYGYGNNRYGYFDDGGGSVYNVVLPRDETNSWSNLEGGQPANISAQNLNLELNITDHDMKIFLLTNAQIATALESYLIENSYSQESKKFITWAINYLCYNRSVTFEDFKANYMTTTEGIDGVYDSNFINNTQQKNLPLPKLLDFYNAFPKNEINGKIYPMQSSEVYTLAGGYLNQQNKAQNIDYQNACAIRGSIALNSLNLLIPESSITRKGADNKNFIINAKNFNEYMHKNFGNPTNEIHGQDAADINKVAEFLLGKTGIYTIIKINTSYSGHVDMIINGKCISGTYINPPGGIEKIEIWELK